MTDCGRENFAAVFYVGVLLIVFGLVLVLFVCGAFCCVMVLCYGLLFCVPGEFFTERGVGGSKFMVKQNDTPVYVSMYSKTVPSV